ncbi:MAG: hypothetical protein CMM38_07275 [Rhodospirillaceae bacterium]|nr:hypothetical protein [Rhodospirillaceae bacterium]|tara:strand:- start:3573 stop:3866 length:294 start_codon:yes stop_codon:yes gene_type:complete
MPKGYWVAAYHEIHDADKFAAYLKLAGPAIAAGGGTFLTRGMASKVYEAGVLQRTTIVEFESLHAALIVHDGQAYAKALEVLDGAVTRDLRFVEGIE